MPPETTATLAPDPMTNTTPPSAPPVTPAAVADTSDKTDWDFLDTPVDDVPLEDARFNDEEDDTGDDVKPADAPPADANPEDKPAETAEAAKPAAPTEDQKAIQAEAAFYKEFDQALRNDPKQVASAILDGMDARARAAFLQQYIGETTYPEFKVEEYEPQGEMEEALRHRWQDIDSIPQVIAETRQLDKAVRAIAEDAAIAPQLVAHVSEANVVSQIALYQLEALCELLEIELPMPDPKALIGALDGGKATYRDAVRKAISYKDKIEAKRQSGNARPITPGNGTRRPATLTKEMSAADIARAMGTIPNR